MTYDFSLKSSDSGKAYVARPRWAALYMSILMLHAGNFSTSTEALNAGV